MGDRNDGALELVQEPFQPGDGPGIEVVGGLSREEQIGQRVIAAGEGVPRVAARHRTAWSRRRRLAGSAGRPWRS